MQIDNSAGKLGRMPLPVKNAADVACSKKKLCILSIHGHRKNI